MVIIMLLDLSATCSLYSMNYPRFQHFGKKSLYRQWPTFPAIPSKQWNTLIGPLCAINWMRPIAPSALSLFRIHNHDSEKHDLVTLAHHTCTWQRVGFFFFFSPCCVALFVCATPCFQGARCDDITPIVSTSAPPRWADGSSDSVTGCRHPQWAGDWNGASRRDMGRL